ncbi:Reducing polyketide synthase FUB1 [Cladobotryum mycophilum]|uniref:Reducing polyketide synthase FUB1 n=1 Tax=Cladobotryum mycophilum TaxID=491253 RepID=A0ABR0SFS2_9HYPO
MAGHTHKPDDIAVIGLGLRFPGNATSPEELWDVLNRKESQWSEFPKDRLNIDGYYHPSDRRQGSICFKGAHFLKEDITSFDASFFSIPTDEANAIDPQQRILLEVSYEALENAGIKKEDIDGGDCAVYVGSFVKDYEQICLRDPDWSPQYAATGNGTAIMSNRISYALNLHGPSMTLDTGCSASLIAVHLAAQSLRTGEASLAIAAGAGMILSPNTIMPMTALGFLSPEGRCFTFDSRANGYGRGEGIGSVILKRLSDAIRDNDTIHAVIRSSSTNQDGKTTGITLPSKEAQVANIRNAYAVADLDFNQTGYVECHGTGTQAGDWRELKAISETIAAGRPADRPVVVGSVKPNIGHLEGAAGIAGLIKGGNPNIDFEDWRVKVPTEVLNWPLPGIRRASVNCFGFGGSNAHVILDEASGYLSARGLKGNYSSIEAPRETVGNDQSNAPQLFLYSASDKGGVVRIMNSHLKTLEAEQANASPDFLRNYAYTLGSRRSNLDWKGFIVADSAASLHSKITEFDDKSTARSSLEKKPKLGFVFCGQGSQWAQMGKDLMSYSVFSASLNAASAYMKHVLGSSFDIVEEIFKAPTQSRISYPEIAQPATTALQVAIVDLLASFDILPKHVVGHSSGEIAAAYAVGSVSREAAWKIAYYRGLAAASIPIRAPKLRGGMMVVGMSLEKTEKYLLSVAKSARVACVNSPRSITVSGQEEAIQWIAKDLREKNIFNKVLDVKTAYHSSHMKLVEYDYKDSLGILHANPTSQGVKMFSSVTGELALGSELDAEYWARNLVSPVQYVAAVESLMSLPLDERPDILVEISPSAALRSPTVDILSDDKAAPKYYSVLERKQAGPESLLKLIGELWSQGRPINMDNVVDRGDSDITLKCLSTLPTYPWNHSKKYWYETHLSRANRFRKYPRQDLIGSPTADSVPFEPRWRGYLRVPESPWIQDHQVQKAIVYPAAGMVSMVLEGAKQMAIEANSTQLLGFELADLIIEKAILVPNTAHGIEVALNIRSDPGSIGSNGRIGVQEFAIYSKPLDRAWERHATGTLRFHYKVGDWEATFHSHEAKYKVLDETCTESLVPRQLYEHLDAVGMNYGSTFQNLIEVRKNDNASISKVRIPDTKSKMPAKFEYPHLIHPATLDAMFHTLLAIEPVPMVPVAIKSLFVSANIGAEAGTIFKGHSTTSITGIRDAEATIVMRQPDVEHGYVVIDGLRLTRLSTPSPLDGGFLANHRNLCTQIFWKEDATFASPSSYSEQVDILAHKYPDLAVLQVGASHGLTLATLGVVAPSKDEAPRLARYTIVGADDDETVSRGLLFVKGTSLEAFMETSSDVSTIQATYNLIVVGNDSQVDVESLKTLLKPNGFLLTQTKYDQTATDAHVRFTDEATELILEVYKSRPTSGSKPGDVILLTSSESNQETDEFLTALKQLQEADKLPFSISTTSAEEILANPELIREKVVVSLLDFSGVESRDSSVYDWEQKDFNSFYALQNNAKALLWITRGANMTPKNPKGSLIVGIARTLMSEDPLKTVVTFDLDIDSKLQDLSVINNFLSVFNTAFGTKPGPGPLEVEYAEKAGKLYVPRLTTISPLNRIIEDDDFDSVIQKRFDYHKGPGLQLSIARPGIKDDNLYFTESEPKELQEDEVEIAFDEASLSFLDIETVLGRTNDSFIGLDVKGQIKRVGSAVSDFSTGDEVVALVKNGSIQNTLNVQSQFVKRLNTKIVPSFFISAYYALFHVGRATRGRKVLVHAGASAFGLAAIDLALAAGVGVFATVFGAEVDQQREILETRGISKDHILDAEAGSFIGALQVATNGKGVDVVYNPTLEHIDVHLKYVRKCGTVVQFASKSPAPQSARASLSSMTIVNFDLRQLLEEDSEFVGELFDRTVQLLEELSFSPAQDASGEKRFDVSNLKNSLLHIQQAPYFGFASVVANLDSKSTVSVLNNSVTKPLNKSLDPEGTYLLAGGLGGLGKSISELLVSNGVRHLAYLSRSGASSEAAKSFTEDLKSKGVDARAYAVDICDAAALESTIKTAVTAEMPSIRGVFQCAAVIKDAVFDNMTFGDWDIAVKPKTVGSWNLVQALNAAGQDPFYVFLASSAGVIGNRGQANYASGNCFEDAMARCLRLQGKHAVSIDLGPILGAGMLAEDESILDILRASGFYGIRHSDFLKVVEHAIIGETTPGTPVPTQITLGIGSGGIINQNQPADPYWSRTALYSYLNLVDMPPPDLTITTGSSNLDMKSMLACASDVDSATNIVCIGLSNMLAKAMNMLPEEIDINRPPNNYGVDSLVAVGVRNWILSNCSVQFSVFEILSDSTIIEMSKDIAEKGGYGR